MSRDLKKRYIDARDFLSNPQIIHSYQHKYVLLYDISNDISHKNLLIAIEQMENQGWMLHNITSRFNSNGVMYALMRRRSKY